MSRGALDIPADAVLGDWAPRLDPARVMEACREQLGRIEPAVRSSWRACRVVEALYHPGRHVRVAYALLSDPLVPPLRAWPEAQIVYLHAPVREPMSRRGTAVSIDGAPAEAYYFPNDRRLRGLRKFAGRLSAVHTWQAWIDQAGDDFAIEPDSLQRLLFRYVPEQKWIVRLRAEGRRRLSGRDAKARVAVRSGSLRATYALHQRHVALSKAAHDRSAPFFVPEVVGADFDRGLLATRWVRGETLTEALSAGSPVEVMDRVAAVLAAFHSLPVPRLPRMSSHHVLHRVRQAAQDLAAAAPHLGQRLAALTDEFGSRLTAVPDVEPAALHNDFHWNQLRFRHDRVAVLDLERICVGDPLIDVANFATQIQMLGHRAGCHAFAAPATPRVTSAVAGGESMPHAALHDAQRWSQMFLAAWERHGRAPLDADRFRLYALLSLLELARGMLRHLRPEWRALTLLCVRRAEELLAAHAPDEAPA